MDIERRVVLRTLAQFAMALPLGGRACWPRTGRSAAPAGAGAAHHRGDESARRAVRRRPSSRDLKAAEESGDGAAILAAIDRTLASRCLAEVRINPESRVSIARGQAAARLVEQGWRAFLVKVRNEAGVTSRLVLESPQARPVYGRRPATRWRRPACGASTSWTAGSRSRCSTTSRWSRSSPGWISSTGSSRCTAAIAAGARRSSAPRSAPAAKTSASATAWPSCSQIDPSHDVTFRVRDEHGRPAVASFVVEDPQGRVYPARSKRLAPDFFFQKQVYRGDGDTCGSRPANTRSRAAAGRSTTASSGASASPPAGAPRRSRSSCRDGSIRRRTAGTPAITTSTPPAAATTRARPRASGPKT